MRRLRSTAAVAARTRRRGSAVTQARSLIIVTEGSHRLAQVLPELRKILVAALTSVIATAALADTITGTASVIDGDTIEIHGQRIRLHAIDAIESRQRCYLPDGRAWNCGKEAAIALADRIGRVPVACEIRDVDRYGRWVGVCRQGREDLNAWLVRTGWAVAYRRYGFDYVAEEKVARGQRAGIWASTFEMPWDWRRR